VIQSGRWRLSVFEDYTNKEHVALLVDMNNLFLYSYEVNFIQGFSRKTKRT